MKPPFQLHISLLLAAAFIALLSNRRGDWVRGTVTFVLTFAIIEGVVMTLLRRRFETLRYEAQEFEQSLANMSQSEAQASALTALEGLNGVTLRGSGQSGSMPDVVSGIFGRYSRIELPSGAYLELGSRQDGFTQVGRTFDGISLIVRDMDGSLFEWDEPGNPPAEQSSVYPSIYHWVVKNV